MEVFLLTLSTFASKSFSMGLIHLPPFTEKCSHERVAAQKQATIWFDSRVESRPQSKCCHIKQLHGKPQKRC